MNDPSSIKLDFPTSVAAINQTVHSCSSGMTIKPELVMPADIRARGAYKRFQHLDQKEDFRIALLRGLNKAWSREFSVGRTDKMMGQFMRLAQTLDDRGAVIFGDLINKTAFQVLVDHYDLMLEKSGSKSWIHSYINLGNHPEFLSNSEFNGAFLHPLLIALVSFRIGGPIRIVDGRGKNAEPISVQAQDNMLHIDNTPFNDEYKILVKWQKGKASGPKGQNFVFLPGTHKGTRNCLVTNGQAWSSENGSIFITRQAIEKLVDLQKQVLGSNKPVVVEAHDDNKPLTSVFAAGSLVHHRYRTQGGHSRSCVIVALHRAADNPGQFMAPQYVKQFSQPGDLNSYLFGYHDASSNNGFIQALADNASQIGVKLHELTNVDCSAQVIPQRVKELSTAELEQWKEITTSAPTVESLKMSGDYLPLGATLTQQRLCPLLIQMMMFDKHGPLDLILYNDSHEEIRKWARNRIREMRPARLEERLNHWVNSLQQPSMDRLLTPEDLQKLANLMVASIDNTAEETVREIDLDKVEKISAQDAYRSMRQLIVDLGEAVTRCDNRQTFLSTSLFLFWACDELSKFQHDNVPDLQQIGRQLFNHYFSMAIVLEKQIKLDKSMQNSLHSLMRGEMGLVTNFTRRSVGEKQAHEQHEHDKKWGLVVVEDDTGNGFKNA